MKRCCEEALWLCALFRPMDRVFSAVSGESSFGSVPLSFDASFILRVRMGHAALGIPPRSHLVPAALGVARGWRGGCAGGGAGGEPRGWHRGGGGGQRHKSSSRYSSLDTLAGMVPINCLIPSKDSL